MITTLLLLAGIIVLDLVILSVDVLVLSLMLLLIAYRYKRNTKFDPLVYGLATSMTVLAIFVDVGLIRSGLLGFSMLNIVMFTGVLPDHWDLTKKLKTYRSFYSILGVIFILPHGYFHLFVDQEIRLFGIAAIVLILPLFLTSFQRIKKEMQLNEWVKLQKLSYVVYLLLFIHLISVAQGYGKIVYAVMLTLYVNNKLVKEFR